MAQTFFFYDLETSGLNPREARIMQFAGIRTTTELEPIGEPYNILVKLNDDTLPSPEAILVTGITPQQTQADGYTEAEFAKILTEEIFTPDTITVGFNNVRFDDEFIRYLLWRNFHDPYAWAWKDGRSRWDILDVVRMTRALRPEGIEWPVDAKGNATNRLELLTKINGIEHMNAHDALSDVEALIAVTRLIRNAQPQLYTYLLNMRHKNSVKSLVNLDDKRPFVYTSGRYDAEHNKTTIAFPLTSGKNNNVVVYDLRYDPTPFLTMNQDELRKKLYATWEERQTEGFLKLPVKELQYNRAPAIAPVGVLEQSSGWSAIHLSKDIIEQHKKQLLSSPSFAENIRSLFESQREYTKSTDVEAQLYDGFLSDGDTLRVETVRNATIRELVDFHPQFGDERLETLLRHFKARNAPESLSEDEVAAWDEWRANRLARQMPGFMTSLQKLTLDASEETQFILQELHLWAESVMPDMAD